MSSDGGESPPPLTLELLRQLDQPTHIQNPNPNGGGGGDDDGGESPRTLTLELLQQLDQPKPSPPKTDIQNPNPSSNPSERPEKLKFRPVPPVPPQLAFRNNPMFMTKGKKKTMSEKAKSHKWKEWALKEWTLPSSPHLLCAMHAEFLKRKVSPQYDIYSQLPTTITNQKRFNLKEEMAYLLYGKRYPGKNPGETNRKFVVDGIKGRWRDHGSMGVVAGPNGQVCGMHFSMVLEYFGRLDAWIPTDWYADEYISVTSEEGESSVVVLRCKGEEWNRVEKEVHLAEDQLLLCYQQLVSAEYEGFDSEIGRLNSLVFESEVRLGCALTQFQHYRNAVKNFEELFFGVKGKAIEESVNLELGLGVGEGGCCSERAVSIGNYYLGLKKKKDEKTRKQKTNTPTAVGGQNILEADEVTDPLVSTDVGQNILEADEVTDPLVSTPVVSTFLSSLLESKSKEEEK